MDAVQERPREVRMYYIRVQHVRNPKNRLQRYLQELAAAQWHGRTVQDRDAAAKYIRLIADAAHGQHPRCAPEEVKQWNGFMYAEKKEEQPWVMSFAEMHIEFWACTGDLDVDELRRAAGGAVGALGFEGGAAA